MFFRWLKRYVPRGLYGRAALILVLPVVTLQLVISVVFIQRHFEGVTRQMSSTVAKEIVLLLEVADREGIGAARALGAALDYGVRPAAPEEVPAAHRRRFYDFSGREVIRTLQRRVPAARVLELPDDHRVILWAETTLGPVAFTFARERVSASNPHQLLVHMLVFGVLMTAVAFVYLRNQLRPITRLAQAAQAFGRGQHVPYHPSGAVEVRAAGHAFLDMRARIERQIEQRTMMLSAVSHDLRTPLTRLKLGLSMLEEEDRAPLERDVEDMQRLLDEFLSFARGDAEAAGEPEPVDPATLARQAVEDARRSGARVTMGPVEGDGLVTLRPGAIRRALDNLIANAVRYGGRAEVSVRLGERSLRLRVEDPGPGIPPDQREEALKPFVRLDPARNQDAGPGVGLGLAIAADIARAHGGVLRLGQSPRLGGLCADIVLAR